MLQKQAEEDKKKELDFLSLKNTEKKRQREKLQKKHAENLKKETVPVPPATPTEQETETRRPVIPELPPVQGTRSHPATDEQKAKEKDKDKTAAKPEQPDPYLKVRIVKDAKPVPKMYFKYYGTNPTIDTSAEAISRFALDVDDASYNLARALLLQGRMPPEAAIRVEEFINSFNYLDAPPTKQAVAVSAEAFPSPHRKGFYMLRLAVTAKKITARQKKPVNLVFVIDLSSTMAAEQRLKSVISAISELIDRLGSRDRISIVTFNKTAQILIKPTPARQKKKILEALSTLQPTGEKNLLEGLQLGYVVANKLFDKKTSNWLVLATDGVDIQQQIETTTIYTMARQEAEIGVHLKVIGVGLNRLNDAALESLARQGAGHYTYLDSEHQNYKQFAKLFVRSLQLGVLNARVKIEFDPLEVRRYRLLGYENRILDGPATGHGDKGADLPPGRTLVAIYEIQTTTPKKTTRTKRRKRRSVPFAKMTVYYHTQDNHEEQKLEKTLYTGILKNTPAQASPAARLTLIVATFAEKLRGSYWVRNVSYDRLLQHYKKLPASWRKRPQVVELLKLINSASRLDTRKDKFESHHPLAEMRFESIPILR